MKQDTGLKLLILPTQYVFDACNGGNLGLLEFYHVLRRKITVCVLKYAVKD